jgi:hypothetical protein
MTRNDGRTVRPHERLLVVTNDYLATGGDRLFQPIGLDPSRVQSVGGVLVRDALAAQLPRKKRIDPHSQDLYNPSQPRLQLPSARPVRCEPKQDATQTN